MWIEFLEGWSLFDCLQEFLEAMHDTNRIHVSNGTRGDLLTADILNLLEKNHFIKKR